MHLILLGAPGVGKGTQAKLISKEFHISHISTGDMFRAHIDKGTGLGSMADRYIRKGMLVPDEITIAMVKERIIQEDCNSGFLLDGFPRSIFQAKILNYILSSENKSIDKVLFIDLPKQTIIERISGRRFCSKCGASYHVKFNPSRQEYKCDHCGEVLLQRTDDKEEVVLDRLTSYYKMIEPLTNYYKDKKVLHKIVGSESIEDVFSNIKNLLV